MNFYILFFALFILIYGAVASYLLFQGTRSLYESMRNKD